MTDLEHRTRSLSKQEQLADSLIESRILPAIASGAGYDATREFVKAFREGWDSAVVAGLNPTTVGSRLAGRYLELLGVEPDYAFLGRLVGHFGVVALVGLEAAMGRRLKGDWGAYAWRVASEEQRRYRERSEYE